MTENYLYRVEVVQYAAPLDEFENPIGVGELKLDERKFRILKTTKCGDWIDNYGWKKFVRAEATRKYANRTLDGAYEDLRATKLKRIKILENKIRQNNRIVKMIEDRNELNKRTIQKQIGVKKDL